MLIRDDLTISALGLEHWADIRDIYEEGLATTHASFETQAPDWATWNRAHLATPRLVAHAAGRVLGWAALSPVSRRAVYAGVAEVSVYVLSSERGRGVGRRLLQELVRQSEHAEIWTLQAGIFRRMSLAVVSMKHSASGW